MIVILVKVQLLTDRNTSLTSQWLIIVVEASETKARDAPADDEARASYLLPAITSENAKKSQILYLLQRKCLYPRKGFEGK